MAKRRNAPALFELLRDSNSTRTGQIGGEQLRTQLGGGTVKNSAPRPPGHPALKEEAEAKSIDSKPAEPVPVAAQVASDAVVEAKQASDLDPKLIGSEVDPLLSMPSFKAGRSVSEKPEPKVTKAVPIASTKPEPAQEPVPAKAPEPEMKPVVVKPTPEPKPKAEPRPEPKVEVTKPAEVAKSAPTAETKAEPKSSVEPAPEAETPETDSAEFESRHPLVRRVGNQMSFSTFTIGMIVTAIPVIMLIAYLIGTGVGKSTAKKEMGPLLGEQADHSLSGIDGQPRPNAGAEDRPVDPMNLARDPEFQSPEPIVPVTPPEAQTKQAEEQAKAAEDANKPIQITNEDTRVTGENYLHLAPLADPEEARRLQVFLAENGVQSFIREQYRGGRQGYELITLVGIPSSEWSTSTKKIDHEREVKRLGGIWFKDFGGSIDYSRDNQSVWYKAKADGS